MMAKEKAKLETTLGKKTHKYADIKTERDEKQQGMNDLEN